MLLTRAGSFYSSDYRNIRWNMQSDPWSILVTSFMQQEMPVTVGVESLCNYHKQGNAFVIMGVDDKASYSNTSVKPNNACGKFHDLLPESMCVAISGAIDVCDAVVAQFGVELEKQKQKRDDKQLYPDDLRAAMRNARRYEYGQFLEEEMLGYLQMKFSEWRVDTNPEIRRKGFTIARAARLYFPCFLPIGGFIKDNVVMMRSRGACVTEMGAGPFAVGAGEAEAISQLNYRSQTHGMCAARTLVHIDEAMEKARLAHPKYIGYPSDYIVIHQDGQIMRFQYRSPLLYEWRKHFDTRDTSPMDTDESFQSKFENDLIPYVPMNRS